MPRAVLWETHSRSGVAPRRCDDLGTIDPRFPWALEGGRGVRLDAYDHNGPGYCSAPGITGLIRILRKLRFLGVSDPDPDLAMTVHGDVLFRFDVKAAGSDAGRKSRKSETGHAEDEAYSRSEEEIPELHIRPP